MKNKKCSQPDDEMEQDNHHLSDLEEAVEKVTDKLGLFLEYEFCKIHFCSLYTLSLGGLEILLFQNSLS